MKYQSPAKGILKQGDFGLSKWYYIQCDCCNEDCAHTLEIEADNLHVQVHIHHTQHTKWYRRSRWALLWQVLFRGYIKTQSTLAMDEQTAINYGNTLITAANDVRFLKDRRHDSIIKGK